MITPEVPGVPFYANILHMEPQKQSSHLSNVFWIDVISGNSRLDISAYVAVFKIVMAKHSGDIGRPSPIYLRKFNPRKRKVNTKRFMNTFVNRLAFEYNLAI